MFLDEANGRGIHHGESGAQCGRGNDSETEIHPESPVVFSLIVFGYGFRTLEFIIEQHGGTLNRTFALENVQAI